MSEGLPDPGGVASQAELRTMVERYVDELKTAGAFESPAVERALRRVQRHRLLETFYYRTGEGRRTIEPDPGPRFSARPPDEPIQLTDDETDFLVFLGLEDRRACWTPDGPALSDGRNGWAALAPDGIRWWKDASLARELDRRYRDWDARGRPAMEDYQITFWPIDAEGDPPPGGWQIERRFYRQLLSLR